MEERNGTLCRQLAELLWVWISARWLYHQVFPKLASLAGFSIIQLTFLPFPFFNLFSFSLWHSDRSKSLWIVPTDSIVYLWCLCCFSTWFTKRTAVNMTKNWIQFALQNSSCKPVLSARLCTCEMYLCWNITHTRATRVYWICLKTALSSSSNSQNAANVLKWWLCSAERSVLLQKKLKPLTLLALLCFQSHSPSVHLAPIENELESFVPVDTLAFLRSRLDSQIRKAQRSSPFEMPRLMWQKLHKHEVDPVHETL